MKLVLANNPIELLPERAVWWPARRTAVVADVHLGKDQIFRRSGIAIPAAVLDTELAMLDSLVQQTRCERLLVLGDWVHAPPADGEAWPDSISNWRARHAQLAIDLVLGNHDRSWRAGCGNGGSKRMWNHSRSMGWRCFMRSIRKRPPPACPATCTRWPGCDRAAKKCACRHSPDAATT